jgi:hypothetical protein
MPLNAICYQNMPIFIVIGSLELMHFMVTYSAVSWPMHLLNKGMDQNLTLQITNPEITITCTLYLYILLSKYAYFA